MKISLFGDPLELIWKKCIFEFCGVPNFYRKMFRVVADSTLEQRQGWLEEVKGIMSKYFLYF